MLSYICDNCNTLALYPGKLVYTDNTFTFCAKCHKKLSLKIAPSVKHYDPRELASKKLHIEEEKIMSMNLHETLTFPDYYMLRVPGGWIYHMWDYEKDMPHPVGTYVPDNTGMKAVIKREAEF